MQITLDASRGALAGLAAVSAGGVADVGQFLVERPNIFTEAPGRGLGSLLGLGIWAALLGIAISRLRGNASTGARRATLGLASFAGLGSVLLTVVHFRAGVAGWRPVASGALGVGALVFALVARDVPAAD